MAFYQLATRTPEASKRFESGLSCVILPASVVREANDAIQAIHLMRGDDAAIILDPVYRTASVVKGRAARWFMNNPDDPRFVCPITDGDDTFICGWLHFDPEDERQWLPVYVGMIAALYTARTGGDDIYAEGLGADDDYRGVTEWAAEHFRLNDQSLTRCPYCGAEVDPQRVVSADIHVGPRAGTTGRFCNTVCRSVYFEPYGGNHIRTAENKKEE